MKVLVPTDNLTFTFDLVRAYLDHGCEVHVGKVNLLLKQQKFDLVHCHWPEELVNWAVPPSPGQVDTALDALDWAAGNGVLVCSVHNILPHRANDADRASSEYFRQFFLRMHKIGHFSQSSVEAILNAYPETLAERHFVHGMNLFESIRALSPGRTAARERFGFGTEFVVGTFGQLRSAGELSLIHSAIDLLRDSTPKVLFASRPQKRGLALLDWLSRLTHRRWLSRHDVIAMSGYLSDGDTAAVFEAVDAMIIPRSGRHLNSGLLPLAMSMGTPIVAPDYGLYREYLAGSENELYEPGNPNGLARAIERVAGKDREAVRISNLALSKGWGWSSIVDQILAQVGKPS